MWPGAWVAAGLFAAMLRSVAALFEDEVGQHEWVQQQIGRPTALAYSADASDRVLVATASGVVASMLLKDGTLQWRRLASPGRTVTRLRAGGRVFISASDGGLVQAWKGSTGDLTWQRDYPDAVVELLVAGPASRAGAVVVRESEIDARTMAGKQEWSVSASTVGKGARFWAAGTTEDQTTICAVAAPQASGPAVALRLDATTGKVLKQSELPTAVVAGLKSGSFVVADASLVFLSEEALSVYPICSDGEPSTFEMRKVKSTGAQKFRLMPWQRTAGVLAVTNGATTAIFGLSGKGVKHLRTFEGVAVVGPVYSVHDDEAGQPVAVASVKEEGTQIQLLDPASGNVQPAMHAEGYTAADHGPARFLLVRELSSGEHRTALTAADHSIAGIQGTKVAWTREEALASVRKAVFFGRSHAEGSGRTPRRRTNENTGLSAQLASLPALAGELAKAPFEVASMVSDFVARLASPRSQKPHGIVMPSTKVPSSSEELRSFGADKLIITGTGASKLFAIEATSSEIVWQRYLGEGNADEPHADCDESIIGDCGVWIQLLPTSSAPYSELLVITARPGRQRSLWLDPLTGKVLHQEPLPEGAELRSLIPLPRKTTSKAQPILPFALVDASHSVILMPSTSTEAAQIMETNADRFFHFEVDKQAQVVRGLAVRGASKSLLPLWNLELGAVGERLLAAAAPEHREWDHVPVYIKGDASILYKYINSNLLAVVSEDTINKANISSLSLYAIDAVTGHVLHQSRIPAAAQPVKLIACDNWILVHYWSPSRTRFEVTIVELFQAKADDGPWNILFGGSQSANQTMSSHHLETPVPLQQTYIFPTGVSALGVTATLKGITPRSVIMALSTDHLFRLSKDMLNPRRPHASVASGKDMSSLPAQFAPTKEEVLPPYHPVLPLKPTDILTHYNPMSQVRGIVSSPTALESTSIVFCYGLDLFFAPVQTAKAYDVLSPGFNYKLLYASVGLVVVLFIVTYYWAQYKALQDKWK